mmetsp:Transcript_29558/g.69465  ORF Transcript_29558/g.69465 Transcript_29558/m.69465 type:complete len:303 (+) Transcript_29558:204-1112(+)
MYGAEAILRSSRAQVGILPTSFQQPLTLQLGGSDPDMVAQAAAKAQALGHTDFNLNCGCPSSKVAGAGAFGAALMLRPDLVARILEAVREAAPNLRLSVKCRIGVVHELRDADRPWGDFLLSFVDDVHRLSGVDTFYVHARVGVLDLSPAHNRSVPPLLHSEVYNLAACRPSLQIHINGGVGSYDDVSTHLGHDLAGVMVGRHAWADPWWFATSRDSEPLTRAKVIDQYLGCLDEDSYVSYSAQVSPLARLVLGIPGAGAFRRKLDELRAQGAYSAITSATSLLDKTALHAPLISEQASSTQ